MKALVKKTAEPGLWLEEIPVPQIGYHDVLVRIERTSICGTDVHIYNWNGWAQRTIRPPMVIGHEFVGVVEKVGAHVSDFKKGIQRIENANKAGETCIERYSDTLSITRTKISLK